METLQSVYQLVGIAWTIGLIFGLGLGIFIGKYLERIEWNKLIDEGKIPKPNKK